MESENSVRVLYNWNERKEKIATLNSNITENSTEFPIFYEFIHPPFVCSRIKCKLVGFIVDEHLLFISFNEDRTI